MSSEKPLVLILCGGQSLRLWPLSTYKSKNFFDVFGFSPLTVTVKRFLKITSADRIFLVTGVKEKESVFSLGLIRKKNIIVEPESRNTAAAILLSLLNLKEHETNTLIVSPVDHYIEDEGKFRKALDTACSVAATGALATIGIKPGEASTQFGYIQASIGPGSDVGAVKRFVEKPNKRRAARLVKRGGCFYNSGIFIARIDVLLDEFQKYYAHYADFVEAFGQGAIPALYRRLNRVPFDKAIMERTRKAKVVRADFYWQDFGSWQAVYQMLAKDADHNVKKGSVHIWKGKNNFLYVDDPKKKVLALGLQDLFFVDTSDCTLLTTRAYLDDLKAVLQKFI